MDAFKVLGSLLGNNATSSELGGNILGQLIGGLASGAQGGQAGGGGLTDILGGLMGGGAQGGRAGGGLTDILSGLAGSGAQTGRPGGGGLADVLGGLMGGGAQTGRTGGGLTDILSNLTGGGGLPGGTQGGAGAGLLGGLVMAALQMFAQGGGAAGQSSLSGLAGMLAPGQATPAAMDATQAHRQALALVKAMINAAKADGQIDAEEQQKIVSKLTDLGPQEAAFVQDELNKPLNFDFFADITQDMVLQVYAASLMAISLDTPAESSYMQQLAQGLGLDPQTVNGIHAQLGLGPLYG